MPPEMVVALAMPPAETVCKPPLPTVVSIAVPPESTNSSPPLIVNSANLPPDQTYPLSFASITAPEMVPAAAEISCAPERMG